MPKRKPKLSLTQQKRRELQRKVKRKIRDIEKRGYEISNKVKERISSSTVSIKTLEKYLGREELYKVSTKGAVVGTEARKQERQQAAKKSAVTRRLAREIQTIPPDEIALMYHDNTVNEIQRMITDFNNRGYVIPDVEQLLVELPNMTIAQLEEIKQQIPNIATTYDYAKGERITAAEKQRRDKAREVSRQIPEIFDKDSLPNDPQTMIDNIERLIKNFEPSPRWRKRSANQTAMSLGELKEINRNVVRNIWNKALEEKEYIDVLKIMEENGQEIHELIDKILYDSDKPFTEINTNFSKLADLLGLNISRMDIAMMEDEAAATTGLTDDFLNI